MILVKNYSPYLPSSHFVTLFWTNFKYDVSNVPTSAACSVVYRDEFKRIRLMI